MEAHDDENEPDSFDDDFIDISVGSTSPSGKRNRTPRERTPERTGAKSPRRLLAVGAAVVAAIAVIGSLFGTGADAPEIARPAPTSPPEVLTPLPDADGGSAQPRPTPTVVVPIVSAGLSRAGEDCRVALDDDYLTEVVFTIPDGRTMRNCAHAGPLLRDPRADVPDSLGTVQVSRDSLGALLSSARFRSQVESVTWQPVNGLRAYRIDLTKFDDGDPDRVHLIEVPGGSVIVFGSDRDVAPGISESIDELVASIRVEGPAASAVGHVLPESGGWCAGDHYVTKVPDGWFAGEACRWLNTSSESPTVLQCECLPPLWIEHVRIPFDGDFGFALIDSDEYVAQPNGSTVRIIEGLRRDPNNMDRPLRAVVIEGGVERAVVLATEFPEHTLPGHTWQDTLAAQQYLVENLRFHSQPECGPGERLIAAVPVGPFVEIEIGTDTLGLPSGSAVRATGCVREGPRGVQAEVRVEARPDAVGWIDAALLSGSEVQLCPSAEGNFNPQGWDQNLVGDFDGDGRTGWVYVRGSDPEWASSDELHDQVPDVAILFANGGLATAATGRVGTPTVERFVGMGRDVVGLTYDAPAGGTAWAVYAVVDCELEPIFEGVMHRGELTRSGFCRTRSALSDSLRAWEETNDLHQGWVTVLDQRWGPSTSYGATDRALAVQAGAVVCGPTLAGPLAPIIENQRAGEYELSLQWLTSRSGRPGSVVLESIGGTRYEATGSQVTDDGELTLTGVVELGDPNEVTFEGTIVTTVPFLNGGQPCVRNAGQRFVRRPNTYVFRIQDRINCDGGRTDWIDIRFGP